jgi:hypothetical protein
MTTRIMKMSAVGERSFVEKTRKPRKTAAEPAARRKRAPVKPPMDSAAPTVSARPRFRPRNALLWWTLIILAAGSTAAGLFPPRAGGESESGTPAALSALSPGAAVRIP